MENLYTSSSPEQPPTPSPKHSPKQKRSRASKACDICRHNHRKCPGPAPGSDSCARCLRQNKECTWNEFKARSSRQRSLSLSRSASASVSPSIKRIAIKRSYSIPAAPASSPASGYSVPAGPPSSPTRGYESPASSSDIEEPSTPVDSHEPLVHAVIPMDDVRPMEDVQEHLEKGKERAEAEMVPEYHAELVKVANRHDLLLYAMPLRAWEDTQNSTPPPDAPKLRCFPPSYISPQPTQSEAIAVLQGLLAESSAPPTPELDPSSSPFLPLIKNFDLQAPPSSSSSSESEPDFSQPSFSEPETPHFSTLSPYRHQSGRARFEDPFLWSPCQCYATPTPRVRSPESSADERVGKGKGKEWDWDVGMPDVLHDASQQEALEEVLHFIAE